MKKTFILIALLAALCSCASSRRLPVKKEKVLTVEEVKEAHRNKKKDRAISLFSITIIVIFIHILKD